MPTYAELAAEPWWGAELEPPALARFNTALREHYGHTRAQTGSKGDNRHLRGRHRSINWALNSQYCTNRNYATTDGRDRRGDWNALRATDIGITGATLRAASRRLDTAVRAGKLLGLAEWFGTIDGTTVVGWYEGHASSSDSSHLWHLHLGYWTEHADDSELFDLLFDTITGADMITGPELAAALRWTLNPTNATTNEDAKVVQALLRAIGWQYVGGGIDPGLSTLKVLDAIHQASKRAPSDLAARLDAILAAARDDNDPSVVADPRVLAELTAIRDALAGPVADAFEAIPDAVADELHTRGAE